VVLTIISILWCQGYTFDLVFVFKDLEIVPQLIYSMTLCFESNKCPRPGVEFSRDVEYFERS